jgi:hypothetical protein
MVLHVKIDFNCKTYGGADLLFSLDFIPACLIRFVFVCRMFLCTLGVAPLRQGKARQGKARQGKGRSVLFSVTYPTPFFLSVSYAEAGWRQ